MKIALIVVGKTATPYIATAVDDYARRTARYLPFEIITVPDATRASLSRDRQRQREGEAILSRLQSSDRVVLLDERGRALTSEQFAHTIEARMLAGMKRLVFVIGGPYGFSPEVYGRADGQLQLSAMTFTHEMVRLFFTEQLYRAMTIIRGENYHHQ